MANLRPEFFVLRILWYLPFNKLARLLQVELTLVIFELAGESMFVLFDVELCLIGFNRVHDAQTLTACVAVKHSLMRPLLILQDLR